MRQNTQAARLVPLPLRKRIIRNIILQSRSMPLVADDVASIELHDRLIQSNLTIEEKWAFLSSYQDDEANQNANLFKVTHWMLTPFVGRDFLGSITHPSPHFFTFGRTPLPENEYIQKLIELEQLILLLKCEQDMASINEFIDQIWDRYQAVASVQQSDESYILFVGLRNEHVSAFEKLEMIANYAASQDGRGYFVNNGKSLTRIISRTMTDFLNQETPTPIVISSRPEEMLMS